MTKVSLKDQIQGLFRKPRRPPRKRVLNLVKYVLFSALLIISGIAAGSFWGLNIGQTSVWDQIHTTENQLRGLYSNSTQTQLKALLPDVAMNFTDGLLWESQRLIYTENRPQYQNVIQVLKDGKGACGEFVWVFCAFCAAENIPFRMVTVGYFVKNVVDHAWAQVNPSGDGKTWIQVEVTDSCISLRAGKTIDQLWNVTINHNSYYYKHDYKMVLAYQLNELGEITITDVTSTFSPP
jgi:hypothetical protein